jgi:crotonobetaine/carnitine-CoA ligase
MPYFAVPRYVDILDELPKNVIGRVLKPELRQRGVTASTWDREQAGYVLRR